MNNFLFTSESVSEGHPDKVADRISDSILDLYLSKDPNSRVAVETLVTKDNVTVAGEVRSSSSISHFDIEKTIRRVIEEIGYEQEGFHFDDVIITNLIHKQSEDIALGVDTEGAGDQGMMFGYAKKEGSFDTNYMPMALYLSHKILENLRNARKSGEIQGLQPDAKSQVTVRYEDSIPVGIEKIVVSTQHDEELSQKDIRDLVLPIIEKTIPEGWMPKDENILINPTGRFVVGGPVGDTGLTGRKIVVDAYGGYAPNGGGCFSGKDPTKVDRSAAYALRHLAKNIVSSGLADECQLQISYAIGVQQPLSFNIDCFGTEKIPEEKILKFLKTFDLSPSSIISSLGLRKPIYEESCNYGHFGKEGLPWEKLDLEDMLLTEFSK